MPPIRVLVGEDEPLVREGIVRMLEERGSRWSAPPSTPTT